MKIINLSGTNRLAMENIFRSSGIAYRLNLQAVYLPDAYRKAKPASLFCDKEDRLFILVRGANEALLVFDAAGNFMYSGAVGCFDKAHGIYITDNGELLVTDAGKHVCYRMTPHGEIMQTWGHPSQPSDTGYDNDIYQRLCSAGKISTEVQLSAREEFLLRLSTIKNSAGPFNRPTRMVSGPDGRFFCSDGYGNASVHRFSAKGAYEKSWGSPGTAPGHFRTVHGIWADRRGHVWVADRENSRIQVFNDEGVLLMLAEGMLRPSDFWEDERYIYASETDGGVTIFNLDFEVVAQIGYFMSPLRCHSICGNSQGDLFIATLGLNSDYTLLKLERL